MTVPTPTIVFAHANSFPAATYGRLFAHWRAAGYAVQALERLGHDPRHPVQDGWFSLRDELAAFVRSCAESGPVHLVGHSLGGYLSLMVASQHPDWVRSVVLLDAPIISAPLAWLIGGAKALGLAARYSPGAVSRRRRQLWRDHEEARTHFQSKPAFARWHPQVLEDYLQRGLQPLERSSLQAWLAAQKSNARDVHSATPGTRASHAPVVEGVALERHLAASAEQHAAAPVVQTNNAGAHLTPADAQNERDMPLGPEAAAAHASPLSLTLRFSREVETRIYETLPHGLDRLLRRHPPQCPIAFIGGRNSTEVRQVGLRATQRWTRGRMSWLDGSHLFPFESPDETAQTVLTWLQEPG